MSYRKKTLRNLPPNTREFAKLLNELQSVERRLKNLMEKTEQDEMMARAEAARQKHFPPQIEEELNFNTR